MKTLLFIILVSLSSFGLATKNTSLYTERYFNSVDVGFVVDRQYINTQTTTGGFGISAQGHYLLLNNVYTHGGIRQYSRYLDFKNESYNLGSRTELNAGLGLRKPIIFYFLSNRSKELELSAYADLVTVLERNSNPEIESIMPSLMGDHFKAGYEYGLSTTFVMVDKKVRRNGFLILGFSQRNIQDERLNSKLKFKFMGYLEDFEHFQPYLEFNIRVEDSMTGMDLGLKYAF
ncbi:hypothetical protein [Marinicellulosiphila megalodicopiae]|uniref:hypothetical protein n=1 Tax=Marinicellulosiphila megalodicopiae TaxID=2724896 RepID=UPI003BAFDE00